MLLSGDIVWSFCGTFLGFLYRVFYLSGDLFALYIREGVAFVFALWLLKQILVMM